MLAYFLKESKLSRLQGDEIPCYHCAMYFAGTSFGGLSNITCSLNTKVTGGRLFSYSLTGVPLYCLAA